MELVRLGIIFLASRTRINVRNCRFKRNAYDSRNKWPPNHRMERYADGRVPRSETQMRPPFDGWTDFGDPLTPTATNFTRKANTEAPEAFSHSERVAHVFTFAPSTGSWVTPLAT